MLPTPLTIPNPLQWDKQNTSCYSTYQPTSRPTAQQTDTMYTQFHTLKQINRILDTTPTSQQAKDQKIRSLIIMFQKQLQTTKKLQHQLSVCHQRIEGCQKQLLVRDQQVKTYERTICEQKERMLAIEGENRRLVKEVEEGREGVRVREGLIERMEQCFGNQKASMERELEYLKQKVVEHFGQKLDFPLAGSARTHTETPLSTTKPRSRSKQPSSRQSSLKQQKPRPSSSRSSLISPPNSKQKPLKSTNTSARKKHPSSSTTTKQSIIRRNILAISTKENDLMMGENLLRRFQENRNRTERLGEIRRGVLGERVSGWV